MAKAKPTPLLSIARPAERPVIRIHGTDYPLNVERQLSPVRLGMVVPRLKRFDELHEKMESGSMSDAEASEMIALISEVCRLAVDAPSEVLSELSEYEGIQIVTLFFDYLRRQFIQLRTGVVTRRPTKTSKPRRG